MGAPFGNKNAKGHGPPKGSQNAKGHDGSNAGAPRKELNEENIRDMASIGCTQEEMANFFRVSVDTLVNNYSEILKEGLANCQMSIRRQQIKLLNEGNATMGIFLGKVYCKQRDSDPIPQTSADLPPMQIPLAARKDG